MEHMMSKVCSSATMLCNVYGQMLRSFDAFELEAAFDSIMVDAAMLSTEFCSKGGNVRYLIGVTKDTTVIMLESDCERHGYDHTPLGAEHYMMNVARVDRAAFRGVIVIDFCLNKHGNALADIGAYVADT